MDTLISLIAVITSQRMCPSNHRVACFKDIQFLFVNYTSLRLGGGGDAAYGASLVCQQEKVEGWTQ